MPCPTGDGWGSPRAVGCERGRHREVVLHEQTPGPQVATRRTFSRRSANTSARGFHLSDPETGNRKPPPEVSRPRPAPGCSPQDGAGDALSEQRGRAGPQYRHSKGRREEMPSCDIPRDTTEP